MTDFVKCQKAETCTKADTYTHTKKSDTHTKKTYFSSRQFLEMQQSSSSTGPKSFVSLAINNRRVCGGLVQLGGLVLGLPL